MNIKLFNDRLNARYETLIRNIKTKSPSFYDSYLNLLEETIKYILDEENIEYDHLATCGKIIKFKDVNAFLINKLGIDETLFNKIGDYILKVNKHKHDKQKTPELEGVINYMSNYYELINVIAKYKNIDHFPFEMAYFSEIFGLTERQIKANKLEISTLKDELEELVEQNKLNEVDKETFKSLLDIKEVEVMSLDEQNIELINQINKLKTIKINTIETKLSKALDLLIELKDDVVENRIIVKTVGKTIVGDRIEDWIAREKENMKK